MNIKLLLLAISLFICQFLNAASPIKMADIDIFKLPGMENYDTDNGWSYYKTINFKNNFYIIAAKKTKNKPLELIINKSDDGYQTFHQQKTILPEVNTSGYGHISIELKATTQAMFLIVETRYSLSTNYLFKSDDGLKWDLLTNFPAYDNFTDHKISTSDSLIALKYKDRTNFNENNILSSDFANTWSSVKSPCMKYFMFDLVDNKVFCKNSNEELFFLDAAKINETTPRWNRTNLPLYKKYLDGSEVIYLKLNNIGTIFKVGSHLFSRVKYRGESCTTPYTYDYETLLFSKDGGYNWQLLNLDINFGSHFNGPNDEKDDWIDLIGIVEGIDSYYLLSEPESLYSERYTNIHEILKTTLDNNETIDTTPTYIISDYTYNNYDLNSTFSIFPNEFILKNKASNKENEFSIYRVR